MKRVSYIWKKYTAYVIPLNHNAEIHQDRFVRGKSLMCLTLGNTKSANV